jgi:chaperonin GroEL
MSKIISFNRDAKEKLKAGIDKVNNAVSVTMGPFGRNVLIEKEHGQVVSTKDGVTVAKTVVLEDPIENMAATVIKQAAQKTVDTAGDGTTTSTVLAHSIATQALETTSYASTNATQVKKGIEAAVKTVVEELKKMSINVTDEKQIKQIATLSANGDEEIGELVATAIDKVGRDGIVTVEESRTGETSLEVVEGMQFDRGYKSPYMVTDNGSMTAVLDKPLLLLVDGRLAAIKDLLPILESVSQENRALLIVAEDIDGEALAALIVNKMRGTLKVAAVKAPDFGERRTLILEDIATLTGGQVVSQQKGMRLDKFNKDWFGEARTVTVGKDVTTIVDGKGNVDTIEARIMDLKSQIDKSQSPYEIEKLQERMSKMIGGVAIINVGGGTEIEMKEKKDRLEDALQATKAALDEGILPGAGVALLYAREAIRYAKADGEDFNKGKRIVLTACRAPFAQILTNAGENQYEWFMQLKDHNEDSSLVPNIEEEILTDAYASGIIDPTKVVRSALENAAAAAVTLLMTECVIHEKPSDKKKDDGMGMDMMGGMGM